jgi:MoxR-like ATPase
MEIAKVYVGGAGLVELLLTGLLAGGHILLEGVPGVAKTTLVKTFANCLGVKFQRIQFTPDLLPADITGSYIFNEREREFELRPGPLFANIVLADEVNRAPAKTQSAMLEAMAEQQVTIEGERHQLVTPYMVLATQNPIEQEGVYLLPAAQLDRFLMKLYLGYPERKVEKSIIKRYRRQPEPVQQIIEREEIVAWRQSVEQVHISEELEDYILDLVHYTRTHPDIMLGASPRATLGLLYASRALAFTRDRDYVLPDDIKMLAEPILAHRISLHQEAELDGRSTSQLCREALSRIAVIKRTSVKTSGANPK